MSDVPRPPMTGIAATLLEHEHRYASLFGVNPDALYVLSPDHRIVTGNATLQRLTGYPLEQLMDRSLLDLVAAPHHESVWQHLKRAHADVDRFELPCVRADGREITLDVTARPVFVDGRLEGVYGIARDITPQRAAERALRDSEERYALLAENVQDMISLHDLEGVFLYASPSAEKLLGHPAGDLIGRSVYELVERDDIAVLEAAHEAIVRREGKHPARFRARRAQGDIAWFETTAHVALHEGRPWRIIAVTRDITERRAFEQQMMQSQKMEALGRLAGGIAHDFSNVLTVISGQAELLLSRLPDEGKARLGAEHIREAAYRAAALTQRLLAFSRGDVRAPEPTDLNDTILQLYPMLTRLLGEGVQLHTSLDPKLRTVMSEPTALEQIVVNLVVNARDAMPGGGSVTIRTENVQLDVDEHPSLRAGNYVRLTISDTGQGMQPATAARAFEPFFSTKPPGVGTGLGLAIVYSNVHQAGGDIAVDTAPGAGATFRLLFPGLDEAPATSGHGQLIATRRLEGSETVLVAEDDAGVRALVAAALQRYGYRVLTAVDGVQAFELFRTHGHAVDLLVTDVNMPELNGSELVHLLAQEDVAVPVLYMSGFTAPVTAHEQLPPRRAFLPKPFSTFQLAEAVRRLLDER